MIFIIFNWSAHPFILLSKISNPSNLLYYHHLIPGHCCLFHQLHCIWTSHFTPVLLLSHTESGNLSFSKSPAPMILKLAFCVYHSYPWYTHTQADIHRHRHRWTHTLNYINTIYSKYCGSQPLRELYTILASRYSHPCVVPSYIKSCLVRMNRIQQMRWYVTSEAMPWKTV